MCGILLLSGISAKERIRACTSKLYHRGPDDLSIVDFNNLYLGFTRLIIIGDESEGKQPFVENEWISVFNGEIYNYRDLIKKYNLDPNIASDCKVITNCFKTFLHETLLKELDGFYSGLMYNKETKELFCLRDYIGKKPLFIGRSGSEVFITSELQAIDKIDNFELLPKGLSKINLNTCSVEKLRSHFQDLSYSNNLLNKEAGMLKNIIEDAVLKRLPPKNQPLGVFLSGGLDSSIIASIVIKSHPETTFYCLSNDDSPDKKYIKQIKSYLKIKNLVFVDVPTDEGFSSLVEHVVGVTCSYNPSIISNGIATYLLAKKASEDGLKIIISGEGADELFNGYFKSNRYDLDQKRDALIDDLEFTELRRLDLCCMNHSIESRCPFLDKSIYIFSKSLMKNQFYKKGLNKYPLRKAFKNDIPDDITYREKVSFDVGSGVRKVLVEYLMKKGETEKEVLFSIWCKYNKDLLSDPNHSNSPYFHSYPVFDEVINNRGIGHK